MGDTGDHVAAPRLVFRQQDAVLKALDRGSIVDLRSDQELPIDQLVKNGLQQGFLKSGLNLFPDPRKSFEVPIDALLLPQILQRLQNEHSLLLAPYMLNSASLISELGYNVQVLRDGWNNRNIYARKAPFHGETLKHVINQAAPEKMLDWFNRDLFPLWQKPVENPGTRPRKFIIDGTKIEVPAHLASQYQGSGCVSDKDGNLTYGYKAVWIQQILEPVMTAGPLPAESGPAVPNAQALADTPLKNGEEQKSQKKKRPIPPPQARGILVALVLAPIQEADLTLAKELCRSFAFRYSDELIADRGFVDGAWLRSLHEERGIEIFIPLKRNMTLVCEAVKRADHERMAEWRSHPKRPDQALQELGEDDFRASGDFSFLKSGVLVRWKRNDGMIESVLFVTTKKGVPALEILDTYDQRTQIEESHRQLKCYQGIETLPSKKWAHVVFRILMGVIAFNLMNLFLHQESAKSWEHYAREFSLKTLRQKRDEPKNPTLIVYTRDGFALIGQFEFMHRTLILPAGPRRKLSALFLRLSLERPDF
jgi:hypothetical protein